MFIKSLGAQNGGRKMLSQGTTGATQASSISTSEAVGPQIYQKLRQRIVSGDLLPGTRLSETEIAAAYKISRQPVREAFIKLTAEQLVLVRPQRGTFVTRISVPAVLAARYIREAVEADIVRGAALNLTPGALRFLQDNLKEQHKARDQANAALMMDLDDAFHRTLADLAGQRSAWEFLDGLKSQMNRVRHIAVQESVPQKIIDQHADILTALERQDPDMAETAMRAHLREVLVDLPNIAKGQPGFFDVEEGMEWT